MIDTYATPLDATTAGTTWPQIVATMQSRRNVQSPLLKAMIEVRDRYNGDWVLPDMPGYEGLAPAIIHDAVEHLGMTANQIDPNVVCPAINPGAIKGKTSPAYATVRRSAILATDEASGWKLGRGRAFRHYAGYGSMSLAVQIDPKEGMIRKVVRDPLTSYPEPKAPEDFTPLGNIGFVYGRSASWLRSRYPALRQEAGGCIPARSSHDDLWDCVEWWDEEVIVVGVLGPRYDQYNREETVAGGKEIHRIPNRAGMVPAACPMVLTLDRVASAVAATTKQVDLLARFTALDIIASEKAIFPDRYLIGAGPGVQPGLVGGRWVDGRTGEVNLLTDTAAVGELRGTPDPSGKIARDYLERNARATAGLVAPFQGETYGALRTGRGIDSLMQAAVDPRIFEAHQVMAHAESLLNEGVLKAYRGWYGAKQFSMYSAKAGDTVVEFTPEVHFDTTLVRVEYPMPGTDIQSATLWLGQARAAEGISASTYRRMHPQIRDAVGEERQLLVERLQAMAAAMLEQALAPGGGATPEDLALALRLARNATPEEEILEQVQKAAQERQAAMAPPPEDPMLAAPPEAMPGMAMPGEGAESFEQPQAIAGPNDSQAALRRLTLALKTNPGIS